jgi:hypothetical protein
VKSFVAVSVDVAVAFLGDGLEEFVFRVDAARRVHPADVLVESLVDEDLSPRDGAVRVEPFIARHLDLGAEEE